MVRGDRLKNLLIERGRTRKWLATQCGLSVGTISHVLSGRRQLGLPSLILISRVLDTTIDYLLGVDNPVDAKRLRPKK
jgi:transcriptional regulator with XRE-family HTH domain